MLEKARRAVLRRGLSREDADEIVQEAFIKVDAYAKDHEVRSQEGLLVSTAINLSIDSQRRSGRAPFVPHPNVQLVSSNDPDPANIIEARAKLEHLSAGIAHLDETTRRILLLRRLDNLSYAEIAEREQMSVAAVEKRVARATLKLMQWVENW